MNHDDAWLANVRAAFSTAELVEPPDWVRDRAKRAFRSRATRTAPIFERVRASLIFDSRKPGLAQAGVRSPGVLDAVRQGPRPLLYRAGNRDLDPRLPPNK